MERQLISERTKQGLQIAKQKGNLKGRKRGIKKNKLDGRENEIKELIDKKMSIRKMANELDVNHVQLYSFIKKNNIN